jgi:hypothetical protein
MCDRKTKTTPQTTRMLFDIGLYLFKLQKKSDRGYILFTVVGVMLVLQALLMAYIFAAQIEKSTSDASINSNSSFYGAEGGLNLRAEKLRQKFILATLPNGLAPTSTADCLDKNSSNDGNGDFKCRLDKIAGKSIITYINDLNEIQNNKPIPRKIKVLPGELFEDLDALEYRYKIIADAHSEYCNPQDISSVEECPQESKQEMLIKIRNVPLFQFAAFYKNDLEFHPGSKMVLSGPIHTNGNMYFGAQQNAPNGLTIIGQISAVGDIYSRRKSEGTTFSADRTQLCEYDPNLPQGQGEDCQSLYDDDYKGSLGNFLDPIYVKSRWANRLKIGVKNIKVPEPGLLNKDGDYYKEADLRIQFNPTASGSNLPFTIQAIKPNKNNGNSPDLLPGQLQSLRQPVMTSFCAKVENELTPIPSELNTLERKEAIAKALKVSIASIKVDKIPLNYGTELTLSLDNLYTNGTGKIDAVKDNLIKSLVTTGLDEPTATTMWDKIKIWTPQQIAALRTTSSPNGGCFLASPLTTSNFYNSREDRLIKVLQLNIAALTAWNKEGIYVVFNGNNPSDNNNTNGFSASQVLFNLYDEDDNPSNGIQGDSTAPDGSWQKLGYAAADDSEGGLVIHTTVDENAPDVSTTQSPYGFAITNGKELPGLSTTNAIKDPTGLTIASDQAVYLQGDYNTINKQPASVMADSLNVLSNNCLNEATNLLTCGNGTPGSKTTRKAPDATETVINAAFLSGTDISSPGVANGGLHNFPRLHENWKKTIKLTYRGSMVSLGTPQHVQGVWTDISEWAYTNPQRDYNYDRYFDAFENLPPLTPNLVYLRQEVFSRKFVR